MADAPIRVLVVDDDEVIRQLITINLELEGFDVHTAVDGLDGLEKARSVKPAVLTLDVMMPRMDGWETARRLKADPVTAGIRVIMLSARAQEADVRRGRGSEDIDDYLTKPFDPEQLIEAVVKQAGLAR